MLGLDTKSSDALSAQNAESLGTPTLSVVTLVTDAALYELSKRTLGEQFGPRTIEWVAVDANGNGWNAAVALNKGLERATAPWVVCAHQDVLYPNGWWSRVSQQVARWGADVSVVGLVGVRPDGKFRGHVLDPHGHCRWAPLPAAVSSVDEHVIVLRAGARLRFDPANPGFHCYGTDIAMEARRRGLGVIAVDAPVVHLSGGRLDKSFDDAAEWLLRKWGGDMGGVIPTCATNIQRRTTGTLARRVWVHVNRRISMRTKRSALSVRRGAWADARA